MTLRRALVGRVCCSSRPARAQDTTRAACASASRTTPARKPGVVVLPVTRRGGDSIRAIVQRDLDFGDRVNVDRARRGRARDADRASATELAAARASSAPRRPCRSRRRRRDSISRCTMWRSRPTALVRDYRRAADDRDARRGALRCTASSDELEESLTGTRGIARTRVRSSAASASGSWTATARV